MDCEKHCKKNVKEGYSYSRNQPKNETKIVLQPVVENYDYGYNYATYKPERQKTVLTPQEQIKWQGVL